MRSLLKTSPLILILIYACSKEKENPSASTATTVAITGITERDVTGGYYGTIDSTDWTNDAGFPPAVSALFNFTDSIDYSDSDTASIRMDQFPNPVNQFYSLNIFTSNRTVVKFIIVNENLNVFSRSTIKLVPGDNIFSVSVPDSVYAANKLYRLYYQFYDHNKFAFYSGHGDIKKL